MTSLSHRILATMIRRNMRGWTRVASALGIGNGQMGRLRLRNRFGVLLELDPFDYIDRFVICEGFYESEVYTAIAEAMPAQDGVFWDVGANSGHHAVSLKTLMPHCRVVAFEPSLREIARLIRNAQLNRVEVQVLALALDAQDALRTFHVCQSNSGRNALQTWGNPSEYIATLTQSVRADDLCQIHGLAIPHVVKIDVEGAEIGVLLGMQTILRDARCRRIIFEAQPDVAETENPIRELLRSSGFSIHNLARRERTAHALENFVADK